MPNVWRMPSCSSAWRASVAAVLCNLSPWPRSALDQSPLAFAVATGPRVLLDLPAVPVADQREAAADAAVPLEAAGRGQRIEHVLPRAVPADALAVFQQLERMAEAAPVVVVQFLVDFVADHATDGGTGENRNQLVF